MSREPNGVLEVIQKGGGGEEKSFPNDHFPFVFIPLCMCVLPFYLFQGLQDICSQEHTKIKCKFLWRCFITNRFLIF